MENLIPEPRRAWFAAPVVLAFCAFGLQGQEADPANLKKSLRLHAGFDGTGDARLAPVDGKVYTAESMARKELKPGIHRADVTIAEGQGKAGDCLRFGKKSQKVILFQGENMPYKDKDWSGTVSFWMRLDPDKDLEPGHCDPIQITQKGWDNGALWVDFDKDLPRDFRLGVFSDTDHWNPKKIPWDKWPVEQRPMVTVKKPGFSRQAWTHVAFTFQGINAADKNPATASLYLNGERKGTVEKPMRFTWDLKKSAILLGLDYIGDLDELMIFDRALSPGEIQVLLKNPALK